MQVAESIQNAFHSLNISHKSSKIAETVTISIGLAMMHPSTSSKPKELIQKADSALYSSKTLGRNTISIA
jgi:diguanylate cyclase